MSLTLIFPCHTFCELSFYMPFKGTNVTAEILFNTHFFIISQRVTDLTTYY